MARFGFSSLGKGACFYIGQVHVGLSESLQLVRFVSNAGYGRCCHCNVVVEMLWLVDLSASEFDWRGWL